MANKAWIVMLGFSSFVFAACAILSLVLGLMWHESVGHACGGALLLGGFAWRALDATRSRIKYGPKGRPRDMLR